MAEYTVVVPGEMPGMNEIIAAAKSHFGAYATMKTTYTHAVAWAAKAARVPRLRRAMVFCHWLVKDQRHNPDNIQAAIKFVLDGLVVAGVLPNDGWRQIEGIGHAFDVDPDNPRVEITIIEAEEGAA